MKSIKSISNLCVLAILVSCYILTGANETGTASYAPRSWTVFAIGAFTTFSTLYFFKNRRNIRPAQDFAVGQRAPLPELTEEQKALFIPLWKKTGESTRQSMQRQREANERRNRQNHANAELLLQLLPS